MTYKGWTQLSVGCRWTRGEFTASTYTQGSESGYVLVRNYTELGRFKTWRQLTIAARNHERLMRSQRELSQAYMWHLDNEIAKGR